MAMPGGGHGGYGGPDDYYHQDANGNHNHGGGGGYHAHSHSNSNGGAVVGGGGGCGMEHEQDNAEEARRLQERVKEVDVECLRYHNAANETQALLEERAKARLATEREVKELEQQHEEKMKIYRTRATEINEKCVIGDQRIKELQDRQKKLDLEMRTARLRLREMIDQAKTQEREAILNEERKRQESSSGTGAYSGTNGGAAASPGPGPRPGSGSGSGSAAASYDAKMANGSSMGRRTQSSTGAPFTPRRASTGTGAGESTERGKTPQGKLGRSGAQPKPIDQMRQTFVEDTLTDFFGL